MEREREKERKREREKGRKREREKERKREREKERKREREIVLGKSSDFKRFKKLFHSKSLC